MKPKINNKKSNVKQSNISQNHQKRPSLADSKKMHTPTNTSLNQSLTNKNNIKSLADKFLEYNNTTLDTKSDQREIEPSNNKLYYTNEQPLSTACGSPISPQNIEFTKENSNIYNNCNTNTSINFKSNNKENYDNNKNNNFINNNINTNYGTMTTQSGLSGLSPQNNLLSSTNFSQKSQKENIYYTNNSNTVIPIKEAFIINDNDQPYNENNSNDKKEDTISLKTNTQGLNSVMESRSFSTKKPNYYSKLFNKSKTPLLNQSCVSLNPSKPNNSLLQSIHIENKFNEKKKVANIFKSLVLRGISYLDISKEDLYSNASKSEFTNTLTELVEQGVDAMSKEIKEKQLLLLQLQNNVENLKQNLNEAKSVKQLTDKEKNTGFVNLQKLNHLGQQLKSRDVLMSHEGQYLVASINKMNEDLENINKENEMLKEEIQKDSVYLANIKQEAKEIEKQSEKIDSDNKVLQRAIIIKSKEVNKHRLYIKTNDMKLKGITSHLGCVKDKVVNMKSSKNNTIQQTNRESRRPSQYTDMIGA